MKLTVEDRILRAKKDLYSKSPFYSYLVMGLTSHRCESPNCPTLAVNEYGHMYYNPEFISSLSDDELIGVLCHEVSHVSTLTFQREKGRDPELWNIATDAIINQMLLDESFVLPKDGIIPENGAISIFNKHISVVNKTAEEIYEELKTIIDKQKSKSKPQEKSLDKHLKDDLDPDGNHSEGREQNGQDNNNGQEQGDGKGEDKEGQNKSQGQGKGEGQGNGKGEGQGQGQGDGKDEQEGDQKQSKGNGNGNGTKPQQVSAKPKDDPSSDGKDKTKAPSSNQRRKNENRWRAVMAAAIAANKNRSSKLTDYYNREFAQISESKISWKSVLQKFITASIPCDYTMRRPGRKSQGCGVYFPSILKEGIDINVGVDMSGSISPAEWNAFMTEIVAITKGFPQLNLTLIPWASEVGERDIRTFSRMDIDSVTEWSSSLCGGTDLSCFSNFLEENYHKYQTINPLAVNIIFTDGYVEPNPKLPSGKTLVVLTSPAEKKIFEGKCEVIVMDNNSSFDQNI